MHNLIFATNNQHKVEEVKALTAGLIAIRSLKEVGIDIDIPEPHDTLEKNATEKSSVIYNLINKDCFSEDTGLEVDELNGEPGVRSGRYAYETSFSNNIDRLLFNLDNKINRQAQFKTVISLMFKGQEYKFEGICKGTIIAQKRGEKGFGYDPVFVPTGSIKTFAEMNMKEKQVYSHRRKAVEKLIEFLRNLRN